MVIKRVKQIKNLRACERKVQENIRHKTFNEQDGSWRIRMNTELSALMKNLVIVRFIKTQGIRWLGCNRLETTEV